jgi:hypothetical protein
MVLNFAFCWEPSINNIRNGVEWISSIQFNRLFSGSERASPAQLHPTK